MQIRTRARRIAAHSFRSLTLSMIGLAATAIFIGNPGTATAYTHQECVDGAVAVHGRCSAGQGWWGRRACDLAFVPLFWGCMAVGVINITAVELDQPEQLV